MTHDELVNHVSGFLFSQLTARTVDCNEIARQIIAYVRHADQAETAKVSKEPTEARPK